MYAIRSYYDNRRSGAGGPAGRRAAGNGIGSQRGLPVFSAIGLAAVGDHPILFAPLKNLFNNRVVSGVGPDGDTALIRGCP